MRRSIIILAGVLGAALPMSAYADTVQSGAEVNFAEHLQVAQFLKVDPAGYNGATAFDFLPDRRVIIVQKNGDIRIASADGKQVTLAGNFSVQTSASAGSDRDEKGLLNVLVHPEFKTNSLIYFYLTRDNKNLLLTATLGADNKVATGSAKVIYSAPAGARYHSAGGLAFSPDKQYLYVSIGDTGCIPYGYFASCLTNPNGKILRLKLDGSIPANNPLVGQQVTACPACGTAPNFSSKGTAAGEIWAWGLRNAWRFSVDPKTGNLWVGDVGQDKWDEIDVIKPSGGLHHGYPWREAANNAKGDRSTCKQMTPNKGDCTEPVHQCGRENGGCKSITGGYLIDSCTWPEAVRNRYYFGDYDQNKIFALKVNAARDGVEGGVNARLHAVTTSGGPYNVGPVHFAVGPDRALYYSKFGTGEIMRLSPKSPLNCTDPIGGTGGTGGTAGTTGAGGSATGTGGTDSGSGGTSSGTGGADPGSGGTNSGTGGSDSGSGGTETGSGGTNTSSGGTTATGTGGTVGAGGRSSGSGGSRTAGRNGAGDDSDPTDDGGCTCTLAGGSSNALLWISGIGLALVAALRRKRRG